MLIRIKNKISDNADGIRKKLKSKFNGRFDIRCHHYALKIKQGIEGNSYRYALRIFNKYILPNKFLLKIREAKKGDIIAYYSDEYQETIHWAILVKPAKRLKDFIVRSKWGTLEVYEHNIFKCVYDTATHIAIIPKNKIKIFIENQPQT